MTLVWIERLIMPRISMGASARDLLKMTIGAEIGAFGVL